MAPGIITPPPESVAVSNTKLSDSNAPREIFPDGIRTSGQHEPAYSLLHPYSSFPDQITETTAWKPDDFTGKSDKWVHRFTTEEIEELGQAADRFLESRTPLTGISKGNFPLPNLSQTLTLLRDDLLNGKGFVLFKGFPVEQWGNHKSAVGYMGLGCYLGYFVSQNSRGHCLGHVKDIEQVSNSEDIEIDKVRIYRTNARQFFHADDCDIVGLLCVARALEGGESDICSSHHIWNCLQRERPDVAKLLTEPIWYFDRKGETSRGQKEWIRTSVVYKETGDDGRVYTKWDPYYVKSLARFSKQGLIPPMSPAQEEAAQVLEATCAREALHMILEVGDIQFLSNAHVLHSRTAYKDYPPPAPRRHLMRLWLATPESEGGWRLPFRDSDEKKRGGVQVDDTRPVAPLDAE